MLGVEETAVFGAVMRLADLLVIPSMVLASVGMPLISSFFAQGNKKLFEITIKSISGVGLASACIIYFIYLFFGEDIILLVFNETYVGGISALFWLSSAYLVHFAAGPTFDCFSMRNYHRVNIIVALSFMPAVLIFTYLGAQAGGITGASIGVFAAMLMRSTIATFLMYKYFHHTSLPSLSFQVYKTFINSWQFSNLK